MIYRWNSDYLKRYGRGTIIVEALSVEEARLKVLDAFVAWDKEENSWCYDSYADEDDAESIDERLRILKNDISSEPDISDTHFILGSD